MQCRPVLALLALAASGAAAQTSVASHPAGHGAPSRSAAAARASAAVPSIPGARLVTVVTREYAFEAPDTIPAGLTELRLENRGSELHHVFLFRLDEGKTLRDVLDAAAAGGPPPRWAREMGGPNAPVPGGTTSVALRLAAGRYAMICVIPSADGKPHVMKGMARELVVTPAVAPAAARQPRADLTLTLSDYAYALSSPLRAGRQLVRVRNAATQPHEVFFVRLAPGRTAADMVAWVAKQEGPPPGAPMGGTTPMAQGEENLVALDLPAGEYALLCFQPDAKDGKEHVAHGMMRQISVPARSAGSASR